MSEGVFESLVDGSQQSEDEVDSELLEMVSAGLLEMGVDATSGEICWWPTARGACVLGMVR